MSSDRLRTPTPSRAREMEAEDDFTGSTPFDRDWSEEFGSDRDAENEKRDT